MPDNALRRLRVLRVADVPDNRTGGMSRAMYCTGDELIRRGHEVEYLFHHHFSWPIPRQLQRYLRSWEAAHLIRRRIGAGALWDIVEIHEPLALGYGLLRRLRPTLPPLVVFSHGNEQRGLAAMRAYRRLKGIPFAMKSRVTSWLLAMQARAGVALASQVICQNQEDFDYLMTRHIPPARLTRHWNGVDPDFIAAGNRQPDRPNQSILFVGSWIERKGIIDIAPAVAAALRRHPDARFTVAGCNCPEDIVLRDFPADVRDKVTVIPHIADTGGLVRAYSSHAILLLPSYFEGYPLVMVEAAAMGLAIITTRICGMRDFLEDRVSGLFVQVGAPDILEEALHSLLDNPVEAFEMGQRARHVASTHTWQGAAMNIESAYLSALTHAAASENR